MADALPRRLDPQVRHYTPPTKVTMGPADSDFPWHLGVYDAHCHPTDVMREIPQISSMKARTLTIMASRAQDQDLVSKVASDFGMEGQDEYIENKIRVIPSFGWHPWFSYQLVNDLDGEHANADLQSEAFRVSHFGSVLHPTPEDDDEFLLSLPMPRRMSEVLGAIEANLERYPLALVGEVGLDRSFRLPQTPFKSMAEKEEDAERGVEITPGGRDGRALTKYFVKPEHQRRLLVAQLQLAAKYQRAISVHGVRSQQLLAEVLTESWKDSKLKILSKRQRKQILLRKKLDSAHPLREREMKDADADDSSPPPFPPRICLHSYTGSPEGLVPYLDPAVPAMMFFSFSTAINFPENPAKSVVEVLKKLPDDKILVESDLHVAGDLMDGRLEDIVRKICDIKGWDLEKGVIQLGENWKRFVLGDDDDDVTMTDGSSMIIEIN